MAIGAASGIAAMIAAVWLLTTLLPSPGDMGSLGDRLGYALRANVFAVVPLFVMIVTIANARFMSDAIDPTRQAESRGLDIDRRVAANTLEQSFVFVVATLALSTVVPLGSLQVVWACTIVFVVARIGFWIGYRIDPLYRAPGMSATVYLNLGMILYVLLTVLAGAFA